MRILPIAGARSRKSSWVLALAMVAAILLFQYVAAPAASVILFYLLLAAQSVWFLGGRTGMALTGLTVIAGAVLAAEGTHAGDAFSLGMQGWNLVSRLLSVGLIGFVLTGLRSALEVERWRSSTDHLTGALNRAALEERLEPTLRQAEAAGEALVLAYMDLDGFKRVNDVHGHAAGNGVLTAFARAAQGAMRPADTFARIGGDEFAALLRVPCALEGDRVAELLHHRLSAILAGTGYAVTCSMGALVMDARRMAAEETILEQADLLMYLAKQSGKNALRIGRGEAGELPARDDAPAGIPPSGTVHWLDAAEREARRRA